MKRNRFQVAKEQQQEQCKKKEEEEQLKKRIISEGRSIDCTEEKDYLSEKFVEMNNRSNSSKREVENFRKISEIAEENQQKALETPLPSTSLGFSLLQKFGYRHSELNELVGLGKEESGVVEPISVIDMASKRKEGIGIREIRLAKAKEFNDKLVARKQSIDKMRSKLETTFRESLSKKYELSKMIKEIRSAQNAIYDLDRTLDIENNDLWPKQLKADNVDDNDMYSGQLLDMCRDDLSKLHQDCISYLREIHNFCLYCGAQFDSVEDMATHCPGDSEDVH